MPEKITLKAARTNAGLTLKEASEALGIAESTLISWEKNPERIKCGYIPVIEEVYHYPTDFISFEKSTS